MRRTLFWAFVAFYPLVTGLPISVLISDGFLDMHLPITQTYLFHLYWFLLYVISVIVHGVFFIVHALRNPDALLKVRWLWALALLLFTFAAAPLYWWFQGTRPNYPNKSA